MRRFKNWCEKNFQNLLKSDKISNDLEIRYRVNPDIYQDMRKLGNSESQSSNQ